MTLGQTVERLRKMSATATWGQLYNAHTVECIARSSLYHINVLRTQLCNLHAKLKKAKETEPKVTKPPTKTCSSCTKAQGPGFICKLKKYKNKGGLACQGRHWKLDYEKEIN